MKMTISVGRCLKRKTMLVWVKEYINKNFATCKSLCNLQELYTAFKEKHPNVNIGFSKFCALRPKWCVLAGSKMTHSVCVCSAHHNVALLVDAMDWDLTYKNLIKKIIYNPESNKCITSFLIRNSTNMKMMTNVINISGTLRIEQYWQLLQPSTKNSRRLWMML